MKEMKALIVRKATKYECKKKLMLLKNLKDKKKRITNSIGLMERQLLQLDESEEDKDLLEALRVANQYFENQDQQALIEELAKAKELANENKVIHEEINALIAPDPEEEEELNELLKEYEADVEKEDKVAEKVEKKKKEETKTTENKPRGTVLLNRSQLGWLRAEKE